MPDTTPLTSLAHPTRVLRAAGLTEKEVNTVYHLRGYCHDGNACALCAQLRNSNDHARGTAFKAAQDAYARGYTFGREDAIAEIAGG